MKGATSKQPFPLLPHPTHRYNNMAGQQTCVACPDGTSTDGKRAQTKCVASA